MSVVYIGDRNVGKTHLALELANPQATCVKVRTPTYSELKAKLTSDGEVMPTVLGGGNSTVLEITVQLPRLGPKSLEVQWLDSAGECWRSNWQEANSHQWQSMLEEMQSSQAALLILPPYRELLMPEKREQLMVESDQSNAHLPTQQQWQNRFKRWVDFFIAECYQLSHLLICINKADLFADVNKLSQRLRFDPASGSIDWESRNQYVRKMFFHHAKSELNRLDSSLETTMVYCFVTSIYDRGLLELPWIYLGSRLAFV